MIQQEETAKATAELSHKLLQTQGALHKKTAQVTTQQQAHRAERKHLISQKVHAERGQQKAERGKDIAEMERDKAREEKEREAAREAKLVRRKERQDMHLRFDEVISELKRRLEMLMAEKEDLIEMVCILLSCRGLTLLHHLLAHECLYPSPPPPTSLTEGRCCHECTDRSY